MTGLASPISSSRTAVLTRSRYIYATQTRTVHKTKHRRVDKYLKQPFSYMWTHRRPSPCCFLLELTALAQPVEMRRYNGGTSFLEPEPPREAGQHIRALTKQRPSTLAHGISRARPYLERPDSTSVR